MKPALMFSEAAMTRGQVSEASTYPSRYEGTEWIMGENRMSILRLLRANSSP